MPNVDEYENHDTWMGACVPMMVEEGKDQEQAVAACSAMWERKNQPMKDIDPDAVVVFGSAVKALGNGKVGGHLIRFSSDHDPDLTDDFFDAKTEIHVPDLLPVLYQHGMDDKIGKRIIGSAKTGRDDVGVWIEAQLNMRDEYEKAIYELVEAGKLGWSSGALSHLVEREPMGKAYHIKSWFVGEGSLTPTPAEPRNQVLPIKSLIPSETAATGKDANEPNEQLKESTMDKDELKALLEDNNKALVTVIEEKAEAAATKAVEKALDALPEVKAQMNTRLQVTEDPADRPFRSVADQMLALKNLSLGRVDPRMKRIQKISQDWMNGNEEQKALLGSNETIPSQGEFLLEPTISAEFLKPLHEDGPITKLARRMPVGPNSISGWINGVDETSRATGSRWGGVRGYWLSEGDAMTASQPKFKRINWELNQLAVLQYATDNMLRDSALMDAVIRQSSLEELSFMVNDAFFRGTGAGQPKGLGTSGTNPALISAVRDNATNITHDDIVRMISRLPANAHSRAVWLANPDIMPEIDTLNFTAGTTGILSPYVTYTADGVTMLRGRPVVYNEFSPTLGSVGDLLLWDPNDYLYWEGAGVEGASSIHVQFLTNQTVFRFIYRVDGMPASSAALTRYQSTDTVSAYVALAATT